MNLTLEAIRNETGDVKTFVFTPDPATTWVPGQYVHYTLPHSPADDRGDERWFTISSAPHEQDIQITTRIFGDQASSFKHHLATLQPGQTIEADEPEGDFVINDEDNHYIFIAGGIGITPFRSIISSLHHDGKAINVDLLYANRDDQHIVFKDELEDIAAQHDNFHIKYFIGDNLIDEPVLAGFHNQDKDAIFYVSGPEPMVESFKTTLEKLGVTADKMHFDYFPGYRNH